MNTPSVNNPSAVPHSECCKVDHSQHEVFEEQTGKWDRVGIFLSSLCAIHCLVTPFLLLALPVLGESFESPFVHIGMALFVVPVAFYAFISGFKHHQQKHVLAAGLLGSSMIGIAAFLPHEWVEFFELDLVTIVGSLILVTAHILNRRACQCHKPGHKH